MKNCDIFLIFAQNSEAVLTFTHNLCFRAKIRKNEYPCKPQFYYIIVGCKGVFIILTCHRDGLWATGNKPKHSYSHQLSSNLKHIMQTCPCNVYPFTPHFYIEKLGCRGVHYFLIFALKHRLRVPTICVLSKIRKL